MSARRGEILLGISILAVFFAFRIALLVVREPFFDELFTLWLARKPFGEILPALRFDSGPPLYYFLARIPGVIALRALSLAFATVPLVLLLHRKHFGAAALLAVYPPAALYAVDARAYALCGALVAIGVLLMDDERPYGAALAFAAAAYSHYLGALFFPALIRRPKAFALACALFVPGLLLALGQPPEAMAWGGRQSALEPLQAFAFVGNYVPALFWSPPWWLILVSAALVLAAIAVPLRTAHWLYVVIPIALAIVSILVGRGVYFPLRFESVLAVPLLLWIAASRKTALIAALCAIGAFVTARGVLEHAKAPVDPYVAAARWVAGQARPGETIVATGYCYLPTAVLRDAVAFPPEQALHPGWRARAVGKPETLPPAFVFVGERAAAEVRVVGQHRRCTTLYSNQAAIVGRCVPR